MSSTNYVLLRFSLDIPLVKKLSAEHAKPAVALSDKEAAAIPSQGLLLCPKDEAMKKKTKKKKIAPTIASST